MKELVLEDFGGQFLTTGRRTIDGETFPDVTAYVEWFVPRNPRPTSVTFIHGGGGQGAEFIRTSDGRRGWVHSFLAHGFPVYVLDRPGHGRNRWNDNLLGPALSAPGYGSLVPRFVEPAVHDEWPEARLHSQWPAGSSVTDRFMASQGPMATTLEASQRHVEAIGEALFALTGRTVLVSHSAGGPCGWALSAIGGERIDAILAVEPIGYPDLEHTLGRFGNGLVAAEFAGKHDPYAHPIAVLTGEASWLREANARAVEYLQGFGAKVDHLRLWEHGLRGNGHMMMAESNSSDIAELMIAWLLRSLESD